MDRRQIELQIRIIRVTYRGELRRRGSASMDDFRDRARNLLAEVASETVDPDLTDAITALRREIGIEIEDG